MQWYPRGLRCHVCSVVGSVSICSGKIDWLYSEGNSSGKVQCVVEI